jgi:hypothetical protein
MGFTRALPLRRLAPLIKRRPRFQAPDELQRHLSSEIAHWRNVITQLGLAGSQ